jgi:hypothetical protein
MASAALRPAEEALLSPSKGPISFDKVNRFWGGLVIGLGVAVFGVYILVTHEIHGRSGRVMVLEPFTAWLVGGGFVALAIAIALVAWFARPRPGQ